MSSMTLQTLQCPHCGNSKETTVWDSLNVTLDPQLKKELLQATINLFSCQKCGKSTFIGAPLLYHDMDQQFCVQYYPPEALDHADFFRQFNPDGTLAMAGVPAAILKSGAYLTRPHIVFDMNEMLRYVAFRDGIAERKK